MPKKLGIKPGIVVALVNAPKGFEKVIGPLPENVTVRKSARGRRDLTIWFPKNVADLESKIDSMGDAVGDGGMWIVWPKKTSGVATDLTQNFIRQVSLASGLVDYKICAVDETYSALKFARRKEKSG